MAVVYVNNKPVEIGDAKLNLVQAAQKAGVLVPHYCWHPALTVVASCRMCLVEVGEMKDGTPVMQPRVVPGCQTPAKDGTVIVTDSPKAKAAQEGTLENLLLNHPLDCPVCDKAGECRLQDYSYDFGRSTSRMIDAKNTPPNKPEISSRITLFTDRCIMCTRCVRFTREISGTAELQVVNRGDHSEIDIFPGEPLENPLSGNVVDLCPVGALCSKDFLYKHRVWFLTETESVCPACSTGCSIYVDANKDVVYRLRPRENPQAQGHFMCDHGRFGYRYANATQRIVQPQARKHDGFEPTQWRDLVPALRREFADAANQSAHAIAGVLSPWLTCEEAYLLAKYLKSLSSHVRLTLGPVPVVGEDDRYPKDRKGRPVDPIKFTIHAEKCPNRRGVEEVLKHFEGQVVSFADLIAQREDLPRTVFLTAGYSPECGAWLTEQEIAALALVNSLIVCDLFPGAATQHARYVLPATTFTEKEGTYVNHANLAQSIRRATRPPSEVRSEAQFLMDLLDRRGLFVATDTRRELAQEIAYFAPLADGLGPSGTRLGA